jgi:hypothetical protein
MENLTEQDLTEMIKKKQTQHGNTGKISLVRMSVMLMGIHSAEEGLMCFEQTMNETKDIHRALAFYAVKSTLYDQQYKYALAKDKRYGQYEHLAVIGSTIEHADVYISAIIGLWRQDVNKRLWSRYYRDFGGKDFQVGIWQRNIRYYNWRMQRKGRHGKSKGRVPKDYYKLVTSMVYVANHAWQAKAYPTQHPVTSKRGLQKAIHSMLKPPYTGPSHGDILQATEEMAATFKL